MKKALCILLTVCILIMPLSACGSNKNKSNDLEGLYWESKLYGDIERFEDGIMYFEDYGLEFPYEITGTEDNDSGKVYYIEVSDPDTKEVTETITVTVDGALMTLATEGTEDTFKLVKKNDKK